MNNILYLVDTNRNKFGSIWLSILPQQHRNRGLFCLTRFYQVCWHPSVTNVAHKYSENSRSYKHPTAQEHCKPQLQSRILPRGRLSALYQRRARQARLVWMYRPHKLILCQNFTRKLPPDVEPKGKATTASSHGFEIAFAHG